MWCIYESMASPQWGFCTGCGFLECIDCNPSSRAGLWSSGLFLAGANWGYFSHAITYACILPAYGITNKLTGPNRFMMSSLVRAVQKRCAGQGSGLMEAQKVLDEHPVRVVVSLRALIAGYDQEDQDRQSLGCFQQVWSKKLSLAAFSGLVWSRQMLMWANNLLAGVRLLVRIVMVDCSSNYM